MNAEFEQKVDEVDFAGFLRGGGVELEEGRDADGVVAGPEKGTHNFLGDVVPHAESTALGIGIGKENDAIVLERQELWDLELGHASCGEPEVLGIELGEDYSGFLGFNNCYSSVRA